MTIYVIAGLMITKGLITNVDYLEPEAFKTAEGCLARVAEIEKKLPDKDRTIGCFKTEVKEK